MTKLTDSQLLILSQAANREGGRILPITNTRLNKASQTRVIKSLLKKGFVEEIPMKPGDEPWRENKGLAYTLIIAEAGLKAIGVREGRGDNNSNLEVSRPYTKDVIKTPAKPSNQATKQDQLLALLKRKKGANTKELMATSGWQAHSVRGFLSGTVRKKLGLNLQASQHPKRGRVYTIVAGDQVPS